MAASTQKRESVLKRAFERYVASLERIGYTQAMQYRAYQPRTDRKDGPQPIE